MPRGDRAAPPAAARLSGVRRDIESRKLRYHCGKAKSRVKVSSARRPRGQEPETVSVVRVRKLWGPEGLGHFY